MCKEIGQEMTAPVDRIQEGILLSLYHDPQSREGCSLVDIVFLIIILVNIHQSLSLAVWFTLQ